MAEIPAGKLGIRGAGSRDTGETGEGQIVRLESRHTQEKIFWGAGSATFTPAALHDRPDESMKNL